HAAWPRVRVVVHTDAIQPVVILYWAAAGNGKFYSKATVSPVHTTLKSWLGWDDVDTGLKRRKVGPASPVQRHFHNRSGIHDGADCGRAKIDVGRHLGDYDRLSYLSH